MHHRHTAALHYKYQAEKERPDKPNLSRSSLWDEQLIPAACSLCSICQCTSAAALCQRQANKAALRKKPPIKKCSICRLVTVRVTSVSHVQRPSSKSNNHTSALNENSEMSRFHIGLGGTRSGVRTERCECVAITTSMKAGWISRFQQMFFCHVTHGKAHKYVLQRPSFVMFSLEDTCVNSETFRGSNIC